MAAVAGGGRTSPPTFRIAGEWTPPRDLLKRIWDSRELCLTLARKDFFVRYRRATFGLLWAAAMPAVQAVVLAVILSRVTRVDVPHYPLFIFSGVVAWGYFGTTLQTGATSIVDNASLSSRIYFPRAILPLSTCLSALFTLAFSLLTLFIVAAAGGVLPGWHTLAFIPGVILLFALSLGFAEALSALHVYFRDTQYIVQAASMVWFYVTPVFYPLHLLKGWARQLVELNPVTGPVELFHLGAVGGRVDEPVTIAASGVWFGLLLLLATVLHCRRDRVMADLL
jgi:ABC-type polysaccharide/polyol phosphate export permease